MYIYQQQNFVQSCGNFIYFFYSSIFLLFFVLWTDDFVDKSVFFLASLMLYCCQPHPNIHKCKIISITFVQKTDANDLLMIGIFSIFDQR
jgi:hypothetical protein